MKRGRSVAKETEEPSKKKKNQLSEAEIAASDAARDLADLEEATEAQAKTSGVPTALLERRLNKSKEKVEELQKEKADMEKKLAQFLESDKKKKEEEAKAAKLSKLVENASPGQVVQVGRQVISYLLPDFQNCNILFATEGEGLCENNTESPSRSPITYHISRRSVWR